MKKLGRVANVTKDGLIIVESILKDPRRIVGSQVYDSDIRLIGKIVDVIGRVDSPYVVVKPHTRELVEEVEPGSILYYRIVEKRRGKRARKPKKAKKKPRKGRAGRGGRRVREKR